MSINNRKTIVYIGSIMLPDKNAAAQRALSLSKSFRNLGYNVVIVGRNSEAGKSNPIISTLKQVQGFDTFSVPAPSSISQWIHHTFSAKEYFEIITHYGVENIKCVIVMEYEAIPLIQLLRFCHNHKIPLVADSLEWFGPSNRRFPFNCVKDVDTWLRMHLVYPIFTKNMICISRFLFNHYKKSVKNIVYIPGTIDPAEEKWKALQYQGNDIFTIGYAGNPGLHFEKERLDLLIHAVAELNDERTPCRLLLAGVDESFMQLNEQSRIDYLNSKDLIICRGFLSHSASLKMIASCDYSIIVRQNNRVTNAGFPTKLSESFGCGTPVLTTRTSNISDYIPNCTWGDVCDECTVDSIKAMIKKAMGYSSDELKHFHAVVKVDNPLRYSCFDKCLAQFLSNLVS